MQKNWRYWLALGKGRWVGVLFSILFSLALLLPDPGPLSSIRLGAFDAYQHFMPRQKVAEPAVIIAIDDQSLTRVGQWPWSRDIIANLINKIAAHNPAAIGVDILFAEPDRASPDYLANSFRKRDPLLSEHLDKLGSNDDLLASAIHHSNVVLGIAGMAEKSASIPMLPPSQVVGSTEQLHDFKGSLQSLPKINAAANGHGLYNSDADGSIVRRVFLSAMINQVPILSLALECIRIAAHESIFTIQSKKHGLNTIKIGDLLIPSQPDGSLWIYFAPHNQTRFISAVDILEDHVDATMIEHKVAFIGVTGLGLVDQQITSRGERVPGVEMHAQVLENIFDQSLLIRPIWAHIAESITFILLSSLVILCVPRIPPKRSIVIPVFCWSVLAISGVVTFHWGHLLLDPATPIAGINILYGLMVSATLVGADIERKSLSKSLAQEREAAARVAGELEAASRIQTGMLPKAETLLSKEHRIDLYAAMQPAREVGGDLYDFFMLDDHQLFVLIGDVAGKGLPAAMFMTVSKALAKSATLRGKLALDALMTLINNEISRDNPEQLFVTLFVMVLDLKTGQLDYCNAGHEPPVLIHGQAVKGTLNDGGGPPICVVDDFPYEMASVQLDPSDIIILLSDGITEAMTQKGELYGRLKLNQLLSDTEIASFSADQMGAAIMQDVASFEAGQEPSDDQTLLVLKWHGK